MNSNKVFEQIVDTLTRQEDGNNFLGDYSVEPLATEDEWESSSSWEESSY